MEVTRHLGKWAAEVSPQWSESVIDLALHALEDTFASAVSGATDSGSAIMRETIQGQGRATVIGSTQRVPATVAALANGYIAHASEMDDNFLPGLGHAGCVIFPALWALGEEIDASGKAILDAFIVGTEIMARIGGGIGRAHTDRGWHGTSTVGALAAAAASGRLLKLDAAKMTAAISLAVSMSAGAKGQFGTAAKPLQAGLAAQSGVLSAKLAANGLAGNEAILEGQSGFGDLYAGIVPPDWSFAEIQSNESLAIEKWGFSFKRHPCCGSTHRAVDAILELRHEHGFSAADVANVVVYVGYGNMLNLRYPEPHDALEARFSMPYCAAVALLRGRLGLADFTNAAVQDPTTRALMANIDMRLLPHAKEGIESNDPATHLSHSAVVTLKNGKSFERSVHFAKGTLQNQFDAADRRAKFDDCCIGILPENSIEPIRSALANAMALPTISDLMRHVAFEV
ncbi:MmgE/PrpD family protein [Undibacterium sp. TS12]|uniref:MmgE/PrpD family protein n=1 Tax=Undibacterium sp. TS12 TaxID=2908202 RepID=UPI001F4C7124|nr:MmgE/PrpD family protein [Undibacterium sp. TS12]MCH8620525.1 MmgE/PrpD family protein [Undibacterium sp. TS12]